jgi:hypothetical protein
MLGSGRLVAFPDCEESAHFLLSGGLLSWFIARVMQDKGRILDPFRTPVDWLDFLGE